MDKKEIRALLEKLMGAFADTEEEKLEAGDAAEEVEEEIAEDETPEVEAAEEAAEEVTEDLTDDAEDSDDDAEEMAELEEEDAKEEEKGGTLTDEMKALIRSEVAALFKEMSKGSGREVKTADDEIASRLNKVTGIYGPNND